MPLQEAGGEFMMVLRARDEATRTLEEFAKGAGASLDTASKDVATKSEQMATRVGDSMRKTGDAIESSSKAGLAASVNWGKVGVAVGSATAAVGIAALGMLKSGVNAADALGKLSERTGVSTEALAVLQLMADKANVPLAGMVKTIGAMEAAISRADRNPKDKLHESLALLGIGVEELVNLKPEETLLKLVGALEAVESPYDRAAVGQAIFGKGYSDLMLVLKGGPASFAENADKAREWGLVISGEAAKAAGDLNDKLAELGKRTSGMKMMLTQELVGPLSEMVGIFTNAAHQSGAFKIAGDALLLTLRTIGSAAVVVGTVFGAVGKTIGGVAAAITSALDRDFKGAMNAINSLKQDLGNIGKTSKELLDQIWGISQAHEKAAKARKMAYGSAADEDGFMRVAFGGPRARNYDFEGMPDTQTQDKRLRAAMGSARSQVALGLHNVEELLRSDEDRIRRSYEERLRILENAEALGFQTERSYAEMRVQLEQKKQAELSRMNEVNARHRYQLGHVYNSLSLESSRFLFSQLGGLMETKSRALFEVGKAGAIGETVINTYRAAMGAYAALAGIPIVGPGLGAAAAAAAIAVGMARVQAIRATPFGGAGGSPVLSSGGAFGPVSSGGTGVVPYQPAPVAPQEAAPQRVVNVYLSGEGSPTQSYIRDTLIPALNEVLGDGVTLNVRGA